MTRLVDKTVWITGASSGIGEALALLAAQRNAKLVLTSRRADELERVRAACPYPDRVAVLPLDLTDFDAADAARRAEAFFGPIDVLVNNAGISQRSRVVDTELAVYRRLMELDFFAPVALTKAVLPSMIARRSGHVLVTSSVAGKFGAPLRSGYSASKHALHGFFDVARIELWRECIRFTLVCPGYVHTNVSKNAVTGAGGDYGRTDATHSGAMSAEACAKRIWRAVERNREEVLIGREALYARIKQHAPRLFSAAIKRMKT